MVHEIADDLVEVSLDALGENLRAVTGYGSDVYEPVYTREDVPRQIQLDDDARGMFRHPLVQLNKAVWGLSRVHPTLDAPDVAT